MIDEFDRLKPKLTFFETERSKDHALSCLLEGKLEFCEWKLDQFLHEKVANDKKRLKKHAPFIHVFFKDIAYKHLGNNKSHSFQNDHNLMFEIHKKDFAKIYYLSDVELKKYLNLMRQYDLLRVHEAMHGGKLRIMLNPALISVGYTTTDMQKKYLSEYLKIDDLDAGFNLKLNYVKKKVENEKTFSGLKVIKDEQ